MSTDTPEDPVTNPEALQAVIDQRRADLASEWFDVMRSQLTAPSQVPAAQLRGMMFESWAVGKIAELQIVANVHVERIRDLESKVEQ